VNRPNPDSDRDSHGQHKEAALADWACGLIDARAASTYSCDAAGFSFLKNFGFSARGDIQRLCLGGYNHVALFQRHLPHRKHGSMGPDVHIVRENFDSHSVFRAEDDRAALQPRGFADAFSWFIHKVLSSGKVNCISPECTLSAPFDCVSRRSPSKMVDPEAASTVFKRAEEDCSTTPAGAVCAVCAGKAVLESKHDNAIAKTRRPIMVRNLRGKLNS
jgi:hypothetical protein